MRCSGDRVKVRYAHRNPSLASYVNRQTKLLRLVRSRMRDRHLSPRTEQAYLGWIVRYIRYHGHVVPQRLVSEAEIVAYLTHFAAERRAARSTQMQALSVLLLLYRDILGVHVGDLRRVLRSSSPTRSPTVFSRGDVRALLAHMQGTHRLIALLFYTDVSTTMIYTHVLNRGRLGVRSPADGLVEG